MRKTVIRAAAAVIGALTAVGLPAAEPLSFEVASIKRAAPQTGGRTMARMGGGAGRIDYANVSLKDVLKFAYNVRAFQINAPSWMDSERYDILAKIPEGVSRELVPGMLQTLVAERFQLVLHKETRKRPIYALVAGQDGPKLKQRAASPDPAAPSREPMLNTSILPGGAAKLELIGVSMAGFGDMLSNILDRPVLDFTALDGEYDIGIEASVEEIMGMRRKIPGYEPIGHGPRDGTAAPQPGPAPDAPPSASLFTAIRRLGLKLESRNAPVEYIVIDKAAKIPTEN